MAGEGGGRGCRGGEDEGGLLDVQVVATESFSWDLLQDGTKLRQLLQRDVAVLIKPDNEGGEDLKVLFFENFHQERLEKVWGGLERVQVELLARR